MDVFTTRRDRHRYKVGGGLGGNVQKTTQNQHTSIDDTTQKRYGDIWNAGVDAGNSGPGGLLTGAAGYNTGAMGAGNLGFGAMTGNAGAQQAFMNPYTSQVIDANNSQWQKINKQSMNQVGDAATQAGAFGGGRHGVAEGVTLANNNAAQAQQNAGLLNTGFEGAMNRAGQAAQLGFNAAGQNANLGFGGVDNPAQWRLEMMKRGFMGPIGQNQSGAQTSFGASGSVNF